MHTAQHTFNTFRREGGLCPGHSPVLSPGHRRRARRRCCAGPVRQCRPAGVRGVPRVCREAYTRRGVYPGIYREAYTREVYLFLREAQRPLRRGYYSSLGRPRSLCAEAPSLLLREAQRPLRRRFFSSLREAQRPLRRGITLSSLRRPRGLCAEVLFSFLREAQRPLHRVIPPSLGRPRGLF